MKAVLLVVFVFFLLLSAQGNKMKVKQGEVFKVVLKANHSTGYSWHWDSKSPESIIDSVYVDYVLTNKTSVGGGGNEIWEFKAKKKGTQKLMMSYKRPWESKEDDEVKVILIEVE